MGTSSIYPESPAERDTGISNCRILFPTSRVLEFCVSLKKDGVYWEIIGVFHKPSIPTFMKHLKKIHEYPIIIHGKNTFIYR